MILKRRKKFRLKKGFRARALTGSPQKKGTCIKLSKVKPKKPNSAQRKIAKIKLSNGCKITAFVPGGNHNLQPHSVVLVKGGKVKDLPGVRYKLIRGAFDLEPSFWRKNARSKYGVKGRT